MRELAYPFLLVLSILLLASCESKLEEVTEQDEQGNTITYQRRKIDAAKEGLLQASNQIGVVIETANYVADTLHGQRTIFYATGDTNIVETYKMGLFDGPYSYYYEDNVLKQEGQYRNNELVGKWRAYHENGQLKEVVEFANNEENGPFIEYHANGNIAAEGAYLDGDNEHGELKVYDESGNLQRSMMCEKGRCQTIWKAEEPTTTTDQ